MNHTPETLRALLDAQREAFHARPFPDWRSRREALDRLRAALLKHRVALQSAADQDFGGRSPHETLFADIMPALQAIDHARRHLRRWMRPERRKVGIMYQPGQARVFYQPKGVVGIISPWNYPVVLALGPLAGALAAGNRAMLKPSEYTPRLNAVLRTALAEAFDEREVAVVEGEAETGAAFSALPFDHLLFTGSTAVGRKIMEAASRNLVPVTLELGGKSPAIVHPEADLTLAAERIAFGKSLNAGQTCIAPDYVLCHEDQREALSEAILARFRRFYPDPGSNADYSAIIHEGQYRELVTLREDARAKGARILPACEIAEGCRKLPLTVLLDTDDTMDINQGEIFGPLLPVIGYRTLDEALEYVRARPRPLALYYFDQDRRRQQYVLAQSHSGSVCLNDTIVQIAQDDLPFGGIGDSGMGAYHGIEGFRTFSHARAVLRRGRLNPLRVAYPPFRDKLLRLGEKLLLR